MFRVYSLHIGTLELPTPTPIFAWYLESKSCKALVDVGIPEPAVVRERWRTIATLGGPQQLVDALRAAGAAPAEIRFVILTHLHFDHAWNVDLFPDAQVVVQAAELFHAIKPEPTQRGFLSRAVNAKLVGRQQPKQLLLLDGDARLAPGLEVLSTPGHTPGTQTVLVETARGTVGLPSDVGETYANWHPADPRATDKPTMSLRDSFDPAHIRTESVRVCLESMRRIRERADIVVPGHDWRIPRVMPDEWWDIPASTEAAPRAPGGPEAAAITSRGRPA
jgi:N-acyl homoserine lactone hydrolase